MFDSFGKYLARKKFVDATVNLSFAKTKIKNPFFLQMENPWGCELCKFASYQHKVLKAISSPQYKSHDYEQHGIKYSQSARTQKYKLILLKLGSYKEAVAKL